MDGMLDSNSIQPWMAVQTVIHRWPAVIPVFIRSRMHCVGCQMAAFNTLEESVRVHGLALDPFLKDLQLAVHQSDPGRHARCEPGARIFLE